MNKEIFEAIIRQKKFKLSHPRFLIYRELSEAETPLSARELYGCLLRKKRRIGLTSIYRSLSLFESLGIVFKISNGSSVKYKLCELKDHHHHIICKKCGRVMEMDFCDISKWSKKVMESTGYQVTDHEFNFYGFCGACRRRMA